MTNAPCRYVMSVRMNGDRLAVLKRHQRAITSTPNTRNRRPTPSMTVVIDHGRDRVYDAKYLVTTYAPHGRASHLRSAASTWTRPNVASARELRLHAVVDHVTIHEQGRPPRLSEDQSERPRVSPRGPWRVGTERRIRPIPRRDRPGLRHRATSQWRHRDVARPAGLPGQGRLGMRAGIRGLRVQRIGRASGAAISVRTSASRSATGPSAVFARRSGASPTAWRPSVYASRSLVNISAHRPHRPNDQSSYTYAPHVRKGSRHGDGDRLRRI